ncbi:MAG: translation initiation factor 2 [Bacillota bacterium]
MYSESLKEERIDKLKKEIENLRVSRRILMYLVERLEKEKQQLELENKKLQKNNYRYAQTIVQKNIEIVELKADREKEYV